MINCKTLRRPLAAAALFAALLGPSAAAAESWPARPVSLVVTTSAGGAWDALARLLSRELSEQFGQQFVVENRGGAGGNIGAGAAAKAAPDGHTVLLMPTGVALNKLMFRQLPFDPERDFTPIVLMVKSPHLLVTAPQMPARSLPELIAHAKTRPGQLNAGTAGNGTTGHITLELFQTLTGTKITHVPYQGTPSVPDLLGGRIDIGVGLVPSYAALVKDGKLRGLAVTSSRRSDLLPDVPTVAEAGLPGFEATAWNALVVPAGTPSDVVQKLNAAVNRYLQSDAGKQKLAELDLQTVGGTPAEAKAFIAAELAKWAPVIQAAGIRM